MIVFEAAFIWLLEAVVGTVPLMAHYAVHFAAKVSAMSAICDLEMKNCHPALDAPYAEICILTVVIAGISVIGSFRYGHHPRKSSLTPLTLILIFFSLAACVIGAFLYAVTTVGSLNANAFNATWWVLLAALGSSFTLSIDKAAREPLSQ